MHRRTSFFRISNMRGIKQIEQIKQVEPPNGLFERIILAIKKEQEKRQSRKILFGFVALFFVSSSAMPISGLVLVNQIKNSGIIYFLSAAVSDFSAFLTFWQDFSLAVIEDLPLAGLLAFILSLAISVFTLRLFFYKKRLLLGYLFKFSF